MYQTNTSHGTLMPLLMGCTKPSRIQEAEAENPIMYDPISQKPFEMRTLGTKSLKPSVTQKGGGRTATDRKNEIDDTKYVN